jgi:hypothetical protein
MQFFAALIEHFVVGIVSLIWILPIANMCGLIPLLPSGEKWSDYKEVLVAVGFPAAYVVGMYVDVFASYILKPIQPLAKRFFGAGTGASYSRTIGIIKTSGDESARYLLQLSAREKIARGVVLNLLCGAVLNFALPKSGFTVQWWLLSVLFALGIFVWMRHYGLVERYKAAWRLNASAASGNPTS